NIVASDPLTRMRPRSVDRSINPAPPSRTASYSVIKSVLNPRLSVLLLWLPPHSPATAPLHVDATPAPAGSDDKSARAGARSTNVPAPPPSSNSTHDIECALSPRAQPNPASRSRAD